MANPSTRQGLIDYCLRRLGDPVIEINVDEDQLEDRVDEALQYYREYHSEGTYRGYLQHLVTSDDVTNKYIPLSTSVQHVTKLFKISSSLFIAFKADSRIFNCSFSTFFLLFFSNLF